MALRIATFAAVAGLASAWWCNGHMLVASIANATLSPAARAAAKPLIESMAAMYSKSPDFVQAACWADDIKAMGVNQFDAWHFIDLPVIRPPVWFELPQLRNESTNPWAIKQALSTLTSTAATTEDRARQLRFLIHFVGDLHQPLHAAALYSNQFPNGDMGGNLYQITGVPEPNLHEFWDAGADQWSNDMQRPLNNTGSAWISGWTQEIMATYPADRFLARLALQDPYQWAIESNELAWSFVYTAPQASQGPLPQSYVSTAAMMCQAQVALGGYRLAHLVEGIFGQDAAAAAEAAAAAAEAATTRTHLRRGV